MWLFFIAAVPLRDILARKAWRADDTHRWWVDLLDSAIVRIRPTRYFGMHGK